MAVCVALAALLAYFYFYRGFGSGSRPGPASPTSGEAASAQHPALITWQVVSRPDDGFKVDLPINSKEVQVQAYNETGGTEPIKMLFATPDGDTTFAVTWEDNPPVARVNDRIPDKTLDQARDGMLMRTQSTLVNESRVEIDGAPAREITAKNSGGGLLNARIIFLNDRLFTLMALYPSVNARREQDVIRFYNSFTPLRISSTLPEAAPGG